jgi:hypothetical protein
MLLASVIIPFLHAGSALGWTYTEYLSTSLTSYFDGGSVFPTTWTVIPTGPVSPTLSNISRTQTTVDVGGGIDLFASITVTVTDLFLGPNASVCTFIASDILDNGCTPTPATDDGISTTYWAPVIVTEPPSCTMTSFTYTTSSAVGFDAFNAAMDFETSSYPSLSNQATATGSGGEALFVTTYVSTSTVYPGVPPTTTTACDVYLKSDAVAGIKLWAETQYLDQCVDPRRYLCGNDGGTMTVSGGCGTGWVAAYPPTDAPHTNGVPGRGSLLHGELLTVVVWSVLSVLALVSVF